MAAAVLMSSLCWAADPSWMTRPVDPARVERALQSLSTREKVGQLLLAYPQVAKESAVEVGGILFVGNLLKNPKVAASLIVSAGSRARIPPFFATDIEGGNFNRFNRHPALRELPSARQLAALAERDVEAWGLKVGRAMKEVGLNVNLAPVFDVSPAGHMHRNQRSFSDDSRVVTVKATAYAKGMAKAGIVPIAKHFPGYGDADGDSDHHRVTIDWDLARVEREASVFRSAAPWIGGVMMSNIVYTAYGDQPAILEPKLVALAHQLGMISVTDDIAIKALAEQFGTSREEVVRRAFLAGNDLILTTEPPDWAGGVDYFGVLTKLIEDEPRHQALLDEACKRVLALKERLGLLDRLPDMPRATATGRP